MEIGNSFLWIVCLSSTGLPACHCPGTLFTSKNRHLCLPLVCWGVLVKYETFKMVSTLHGKEVGPTKEQQVPRWAVGWVAGTQYSFSISASSVDLDELPLQVCVLRLSCGILFASPLITGCLSDPYLLPPQSYSFSFSYTLQFYATHLSTFRLDISP